MWILVVASFIEALTYKIIDLLIEILTGKTKIIPNILKPYYPFFKGEVLPGDTPRQFEIIGCIERPKKNVITITEVPVNLDREKISKHLNKLIDSGLVVHEGKRYLLRVDSLKELIKELREDMQRSLDDLEDIAVELDTKLGL